jgi:hypothetical protein
MSQNVQGRILKSGKDAWARRPYRSWRFQNQCSVGPQSLWAMAATERGPTEPIGFIIQGLVGTSRRLVRIDRTYGLGGNGFLAS